MTRRAHLSVAVLVSITAMPTRTYRAAWRTRPMDMPWPLRRTSDTWNSSCMALRLGLLTSLAQQRPRPQTEPRLRAPLRPTKSWPRATGLSASSDTKLCPRLFRFDSPGQTGSARVIEHALAQLGSQVFRSQDSLGLLASRPPVSMRISVRRRGAAATRS